MTAAVISTCRVGSIASMHRTNDTDEWSRIRWRSQLIRAHAALATLAIAALIFATATRTLAETVAFEVPYNTRTIKIEGQLRKPSGGDGPFPVVIGLHACDGPGNYSTSFWLATLAAQGYATYLPDSFGPRGYVDVCALTSLVTIAERAQDALVAAATLAARPDIRGDRIAILGVSHGGAAALRLSRDDASLAPLRQKLADAGGKIVGVVALYGSCAPDLKRPVVTPLLILIGSNDDWALPKPCQEFASEGSNSKLVQLHVYAGAMHSFDNASIFIRGMTNGHRIAFDAEATKDAQSRVTEFLRPLMQ
jgi:dienelactone hydrolase